MDAVFSTNRYDCRDLMLPAIRWDNGYLGGTVFIGMVSTESEMNRDAATGHFAETYPREAFVNALRAFDGAAGTTDIATEVGCTQDAAYKRLTAMRDDGQVDSQPVGGSLLWMLTDTSDTPDKSGSPMSRKGDSENE